MRLKKPEDYVPFGADVRPCPGPGGAHEQRHFRGYCPSHGFGSRFLQRGGIKFAILELLREKPRHGYDIIREMEERSGGLYSPSPGAVYPTLQALEDQDLVTSSTEEGKRVYAITEAGIAFLEEHREQARSHRERWEGCWGSGPVGDSWAAVAEIRGIMDELKRLVRVSASDPQKLEQVRAILEQARSRIREVSEQ